MDTFEKFKTECIVNSIVTFLTTGRSLPKKWGFPSFLLKDNKMLMKFFGTAYEHYKIIPPENKDAAIKWFETSGEYAASLINTTCYEDFDGTKMPPFNLSLLKENQFDIYKEVTKRVVNKIYSKFDDRQINIILDGFIESPSEFTNEITRNI